MDKCYLCGDKDVKFIGCYVAKKNDKSADFLMGKVKAGSTRTYWYGLCQRCFDLPNKEELVEGKIEGGIRLKKGFPVEVKNR
ncbi:hypothetical protein ES708_06918 [subsurface metagenome]